MKKIAFILAALVLGSVKMAQAATLIAAGTMYINTGLTANTSYTLDLAAQGFDTVDVQTAISSVNYNAVSFTDGSVSTMAVKVSSFVALNASRSTATITVASNSATAASYASNYIFVSSPAGLVAMGTSAFVTVNGINFYNTKQWTAVATATGTATSLANALRGADYGITTSTSPAGSTVTLTMSVTGAVYNQYTLTSSTQSWLAVYTSSFSGGSDSAVFGINGVLLQNGADWTTATTATGTANNIATAIQARPALSSIITSTYVTGGVVMLQSISTGPAYSYQTFTSSQTALQLSGVSSSISGSTVSSLSGGREWAYLRINGVTLRAGLNWFATAGATTTAASISSAIINTPQLAAIMAATYTVDGTVLTTSTINGVNQNWPFFTSTQAALTLSSVPVTITSGTGLAFMQGGTTMTYSAENELFLIPAHGFPTGLAVLFTTAATATVPPAPLITRTTYFVIAVTSGSLYLARTSTDAIVGSFINLTSSSTNLAARTFTLTPLSPVGSTSLKWQTSNDNTNWQDIAISSFSYQPPYVSTFSIQNLGQINERYLKAVISGFVNGAAQFIQTFTGKK